jgi:hypothetical protein
MENDFDETVLRFRDFLEGNGFPPRIVWLRDTDILLTGSELLYMRSPDQNSAENEVRKAFEQGLSLGNGVLLKGLFSKDDITYSCIWVPENRNEAEGALLPSGIKLAMTTSQTFRIVVVKSDEEWRRLTSQYSTEQSQRMQLFE